MLRSSCVADMSVEHTNVVRARALMAADLTWGWLPVPIMHRFKGGSMDSKNSSFPPPRITEEASRQRQVAYCSEAELRREVVATEVREGR